MPSSDVLPFCPRNEGNHKPNDDRKRLHFDLTAGEFSWSFESDNLGDRTEGADDLAAPAFMTLGRDFSRTLRARIPAGITSNNAVHKPITKNRRLKMEALLRVDMTDSFLRT